MVIRTFWSRLGHCRISAPTMGALVLSEPAPWIARHPVLLHDLIMIRPSLAVKPWNGTLFLPFHVGTSRRWFASRREPTSCYTGARPITRMTTDAGMKWVGLMAVPNWAVPGASMSWCDLGVRVWWRYLPNCAQCPRRERSSS